MFSLKLFRENRAHGLAHLRAGWLLLLLVSITAGWLVPASLRADEPPTDVPTPASAETAVKNEATAEKADATLGGTASEPAAAAVDDSRVPVASSVKTPAKRRGNAGRLPAYYGTVVDAQQRIAIYEIRARAEAQLQQLQQQIDAIRQAEQAEMEAVLTAEQLHRIEALRAQRVKSAKAVKAANASAPRQTEAN